MAEKKKGAIRRFFDGMFDEIGEKIQDLAMILCWVGIIASIVFGVIVFIVWVTPAKPVRTNADQSSNVSAVSKASEVRPFLIAAIESCFGNEVDTWIPSTVPEDNLLQYDWASPYYLYSYGYDEDSTYEKSLDGAKLSAYFSFLDYRDVIIEDILRSYHAISPNNGHDSFVDEWFPVFAKSFSIEVMKNFNYYSHQEDNGGVEVLTEVPKYLLRNEMKNAANELMNWEDSLEDSWDDSRDKYFTISDSTAASPAPHRSFGTVIGKIFGIILKLIISVALMYLGSVLSWVLSWFLHGFGELIESNNTLAKIKKEEHSKSSDKVHQNRWNRITAGKRFIRYRGSNSKRRG